VEVTVDDSTEKTTDPTSLYLEAMREYGRQCRAAAEVYLSRGMIPLPLCNFDHTAVGRAHGRRCQTPGLGPLVAPAEVLARRPTVKDLDRWWAEHPLAGVGVVLGAQGDLIALDVAGPGGEQKLAEISGGDLPKTLEIITDRGRRLLYRPAPGVPTHTAEVTVEGGEGTLRLLGDGEVIPLPPSRVGKDPPRQWAEKEDGHAD
jgi:hypothetical protein